MRDGDEMTPSADLLVKLLAVIHDDDEKHLAKYGVEKSTEHAINKIHAMRARLDEIAEQRDALERELKQVAK